MRGTLVLFGLPFGSLLVCLCLVAGSAAAGTLYDDLGGNAGLTAIVGETIDASVADPVTADKLDNINVARLKQRIVLQICELTGGPCHFHGISMKGAHAYLHLHDRHFNALVEHLQDAMDRRGIPTRTQNRLLAILAPMRRDIVSE
jgi:hemoglobin